MGCTQGFENDCSNIEILKKYNKREIYEPRLSVKKFSKDCLVIKINPIVLEHDDGLNDKSV